jgi:ATP-dependent DNA helicase PIF1
LPDNFCTAVDTKNEVIESVYPDMLNNYSDHNWLCNRAILAARNVVVDKMNFQIQQLLPGALMSFKSIYTVIDAKEAVNFPTEFLNSLDIPGMPPQNLRLKIGSPVILLRNLNSRGLCNGIRLVIKRITGYVLEATILPGKFKGEIVQQPRIPLIPSGSLLPFRRL